MQAMQEVIDKGAPEWPLQKTWLQLFPDTPTDKGSAAADSAAAGRAHAAAAAVGSMPAAAGTGEGEPSAGTGEGEPSTTFGSTYWQQLTAAVAANRLADIPDIPDDEVLFVMLRALANVLGKPLHLLCLDGAAPVLLVFPNIPGG
jgi:hypothetical protein